MGEGGREGEEEIERKIEGGERLANNMKFFAGRKQ